MSDEIWFEAFTLENRRKVRARALLLKAKLAQDGRYWFKDDGFGNLYFTQGVGGIQIREREDIGCEIRIWFKNGDGPKIAEAWRVYRDMLGITGPLIEQIIAQNPIETSKDWKTKKDLMDRLKTRGEIEDPLTKREYEILVLLAKGKSNEEIAADLIIAESTVIGHISRINSKLGFNGREIRECRAKVGNRAKELLII